MFGFWRLLVDLVADLVTPAFAALPLFVFRFESKPSSTELESSEKSDEDCEVDE